MPSTATPCPKSVTNFYVNTLALCCFFVVLYILRAYKEQLDNIAITVLSMVALVLPILIYDLFIAKSYHNTTSGWAPQRYQFDGRRLAVKLIGLVLTYGFLLFCYWLFPEYALKLWLQPDGSSWYDRYYDTILRYAPYLIPPGLAYFCYMDGKMKQPQDGYWQVGLVALGQWKNANYSAIFRHTKTWIVKGFFAPLMFIFLANNVDFLTRFDFNTLVDIPQEPGPQHFKAWFDFLFSFLYTIDVVFAAVGYLMTFRFLDSHIRSTEPTVLGWMVCLVCYPPFWAGLFYDQYFQYNNGFVWGEWLWNSPFWYHLWGGTILLLIAIYSFATVAMGYRFSNLTFRGTITSGPYRLTKHPAYICKNLTFWMIAIPFIGDDVLESVRLCILLLGLNGIYYLRAKTEERHLLNYDSYRQYVLYMKHRR